MDERLLLEKRKGDFRESKAHVTTIMIIEILLFISLGIITIIFIKDKLFSPLNMLLANTQKMEQGEKKTLRIFCLMMKWATYFHVFI